jgi:hypothetical protein
MSKVVVLLRVYSKLEVVEIETPHRVVNLPINRGLQSVRVHTSFHTCHVLPISKGSYIDACLF